MSVRLRFLPVAATLLASLSFYPWLWERWFGPGGEALSGGLFFFLIAGTVFYFFRTRDERTIEAPDTSTVATAAGFLLAAAVLFPFVPRLLCAGLLFSALYWSIRASLPHAERSGSFALWPLLLLSLPHGPTLQYVLGYPLRVLAAHLAAVVLPGNVRATGCGLGNGVVEVFVDAPCAGAAMLSVMLLLAAGVALIFRSGALRTMLLLIAGVLCAVVANALRAALLFAGYAKILPLPFQRIESATGLFCFGMGALVLSAAAFMTTPHPKKTSGERQASLADRRQAKSVLLHTLAAVLFLTTSLSAPRQSPERLDDKEILWPLTWEGHVLIAVPATADTAAFRANFPGACREFSMQTEENLSEGRMAESRLLLRFVRGATRQLHPAEDCFRGAGYEIKAAPLLVDRKGRAWSGFFCEKSGRRYTVRQCVLGLPDSDLRQAEHATLPTWPDVSAWYWDAARPFSSAPPNALALTVITE